MDVGQPLPSCNTLATTLIYVANELLHVAIINVFIHNHTSKLAIALIYVYTGISFAWVCLGIVGCAPGSGHMNWVLAVEISRPSHISPN